MNIVIFHFPYFSTLGGLESQTIDLFTGLQKRNHQITYCGPESEVLFQEMKKRGFNTIPTWAPRMASTMSSGLWTLASTPFAKKSFQKRLKEFYKPGQKNIAFLISLNEKILATPIALKLGYKVFWVEHVQIGKWLEKHPFRQKYEKLSQQVQIVTPSQMNADLLKKIGASNINIIPNGIDTSKFGVRSSKFEEPFKIGMVARLNGKLLPIDHFRGTGAHHDKGADIFIRALAELQKEFPEIEGHIAGDGPDRKLFENLAQELNVPINFHGYLNGQDYVNFLQNLDIFVAPSTGRDSFNIAVAEALATGIPTIITEQVGIKELVSDGLTIVPSHDLSALVNIITQIIKTPQYYKDIARRGQKTAQEKLSLGKMIDNYEKLFLSA